MHDHATPLTVIDPGEPAWDIAKLYPNQGQWSIEEYLALPGNRLVEFSHGSVEVLPMPTELHQLIVEFLYLALNAYAVATRAGKALFAPISIRLNEYKFREPDVVFIKTEHFSRRHNEFWEGADLVMEVVSNDDPRRDLELKRREYAQAGIPEYWIAHPGKQRIWVLTLKGGSYRVAAEGAPGDRVASVLLKGFEVDVASALKGEESASAPAATTPARKSARRRRR